MTDFVASGASTLAADVATVKDSIDKAASQLSGLSHWPEPAGETPAEMYATWAREWKEEIVAASEALDAIGKTLSGLKTMLDQIDEQAAAAFTF